MTTAFASSLPPFGARAATAGASADPRALADACRRLAKRRALMSAATCFIPIPGIDFITDVAVLTKLIADINERFGVTDAEIARLRKGMRHIDRVLAYRLTTSATAMLAARAVTPGLLMTILKLAGVRLTAMEATRLVPVVGQLVAASIAYLALTRIANRHIEDCVAVQHTR